MQMRGGRAVFAVVVVVALSGLWAPVAAGSAGVAAGSAGVAGRSNGRPSAAALGAVASARSMVAPAKVADLAIPGYDTLSASHVVQRLAGLSAAELAAVGDYETATRGRRTILAKVAQLQASPDEPTAGG